MRLQLSRRLRPEWFHYLIRSQKLKLAKSGYSWLKGPGKADLSPCPLYLQVLSNLR